MAAKLKAGESAGIYITDAPVSETDILQMAPHACQPEAAHRSKHLHRLHIGYFFVQTH